jgi:glycosyltransferase involved in cell wall biosynthesis
MKFSIIIATFNSMGILPKVLDSIQSQSIGLENIEVLLVDGFSVDGTRDIGQKYPFVKIIDNPKVDPVNAKFTGYKTAQGDYLVYLDHDEVLENRDSLSLKDKLYSENPELMAVSTSGYKNPEGYSFLNQYINDFGDPFSGYFYNLSKDYRFFIPSMKRQYPTRLENENLIAFDFQNNFDLPIIELCAAGASVRKSYLDSLNIGVNDIPILFKKLVSSKKLWGIVKDDYLVHYSSEQFAKYKNKIKWRIKNNIFHIDTLGQSGFSGREDDSSARRKLKKIFFIPYALLILPCLIHSLAIAVKHRSIKYLIHTPLCAYTAFWIVTYMAIKVLGFRLTLKSYDGQKKIG